MHKFSEVKAFRLLKRFIFMSQNFSTTLTVFYRAHKYLNYILKDVCVYIY